MKEGTIHGKSKVATTTKQSAGRTETRNGQLEDKPTTANGTAAIRGAGKSGSRPKDQHGDNSHDAGAEGKPRVKKIALTVPGEDAKPARSNKRTAKRLTPAAVERLRTPVGELMDQHAAEVSDEVRAKLQPAKKPKQPLAITSYNFGYESGYAAGEQDQKDLRKFQSDAQDGVTPRNLKIFQATTIFLLGMLIGLIF